MTLFMTCAGVAGSIAALLTLSVVADGILDQKERRVDALTNSETSEG